MTGHWLGEPAQWPQHLSLVLQHALDHLPREACGYVVGPSLPPLFVPLRNSAVAPERSFAVADVVALRELDRRCAAGEPVVFYHSHPQGAASFSDQDRARWTTDHGPTWRLDHLVLGCTARAVTEMALLRWAADQREYVVHARLPSLLASKGLAPGAHL